MMDLDLITNPFSYCWIMMGQFIFYVVLTVYLERKSTLLKESSWRKIFNFGRNQQQPGFANLNEGK